MKKLALSAALLALAAPAMAHEGHPVFEGFAGHDLAHLALAAVAVGIVALIVRRLRAAKDKGDQG